MHDTLTFGLVVLIAAGAAILAVQSHVLSQRLRVPAPALFLVAAACAVNFIPSLDPPSAITVERIVTVALIVILFDGGMNIGVRRLRSVAPSVLSLGVLGTFATVAGASVLVHMVLGTNWFLSVLLATAIAPTDPAVVFSVLGQREVEGPAGTILEGESGANDPVGIALMLALIGAGSLSAGAVGEVAGTFLLQMIVGAMVGLLGGRGLLMIMRRLPLPAEGLHAVRTLVGAGALFGAATVAHGSGFLAVFIAGLVIGDERAPFKREIERFHAALASIAEVVAFAYLGFTVDLSVLARADVWLPGVVIGMLLAVVVRPVVGLPLLLRAGLTRGEQAFVLLAGLKGAVPLLLGTMLLPLPGGERLYGIVVVVVLVSVFGQGTLVPTAARLLRVRMRVVEPEPFAVGMRLRDEPTGAHRLTVAANSVADGSQINELPGLAEGTWVSMVRRHGTLVPVGGSTRLQAGDEVLMLVDAEQDAADVTSLFQAPNQSERFRASGFRRVTTGGPARRREAEPTQEVPWRPTSRQSASCSPRSAATCRLLVRSEIELAKSELKDDAKSAGKGGGMFGAAGFLGVLVVILLSIAAAYGLTALGLHPALGVPDRRRRSTCSSAAVLGLIGVRSFKQIKPPERTIKSAKESAALLKLRRPGRGSRRGGAPVAVPAPAGRPAGGPARRRPVVAGRGRRAVAAPRRRRERRAVPRRRGRAPARSCCCCTASRSSGGPGAHQIPALAEAGYRAVAMDLRGYGGSDKPPRGYDPVTLAADVAGVDPVARRGAGDGRRPRARWLRRLVGGRAHGAAREPARRDLAAPHPLLLRAARSRNAADWAELTSYQLPGRARAPAARARRGPGRAPAAPLVAARLARLRPPRCATARRSSSGRRRTARWSTTAGWLGRGCAATAAGSPRAWRRRSASRCCRSTARSTPPSAPTPARRSERARHRAVPLAPARRRRPLPARGGSRPGQRRADRLAGRHEGRDLAAAGRGASAAQRPSVETKVRPRSDQGLRSGCRKPALGCGLVLVKCKSAATTEVVSGSGPRSRAAPLERRTVGSLCRV